MCFKRKNNSENICRFCAHARLLCDSDNVLCETKGIVSEDYSCKKFAYDFLKRDPGKNAKIQSLEYVDINE